MNRAAGDSHPKFTPRQGQYLAFIHAYTLVNERPPAQADTQRFFRLTPPSVYQMLLTLEREGLISRRPGLPRSIAVLVDRDLLPALEPAPAQPVIITVQRYYSRPRREANAAGLRRRKLACNNPVVTPLGGQHAVHYIVRAYAGERQSPKYPLLIADRPIKDVVLGGDFALTAAQNAPDFPHHARAKGNMRQDQRLNNVSSDGASGPPRTSLSGPTVRGTFGVRPFDSLSSSGVSVWLSGSSPLMSSSDVMAPTLPLC
jgi:hypothetical protein